jgi:hypothetical protein
LMNLSLSTVVGRSGATSSIISASSVYNRSVPKQTLIIFNARHRYVNQIDSVLDPHSISAWIRIHIRNTDPDLEGVRKAKMKGKTKPNIDLLSPKITGL